MRAVRGVPRVTKRERRPDRHAQLLHVLGELVAADGAEELSLPELATRAGVSVSLVYRHFPSRAAALRELLEQVWRAPGSSGAPLGPDELLASYLEAPRGSSRLVGMLVLRPSSLPEVEALRREVRARGVDQIQAHLRAEGVALDAASVAAVLLDAALVEGAVQVHDGGDRAAVEQVLAGALRSAARAAGAA